MRGKEEKDGETCEPGREVADSQRGRRRERNGGRRKEIEVSTTLGVLLPYKGGVCTLSKHEREDNSSNLGTITDAAKQLFPGQQILKAL